jgi:hypothetical protein
VAKATLAREWPLRWITNEDWLNGLIEARNRGYRLHEWLALPPHLDAAPKELVAAALGQCAAAPVFAFVGNAAALKNLQAPAAKSAAGLR